MPTKRKKRNFKFSKKSPTYYINIAVILFFLALIVILSKIFIFDTIPPNEESNKTVAIPAKQVVSQIDDAQHKYEEKTKALEIEYADDELPKVEKEIVKQSVEEKKFSFFDDASEDKNKKLPIEASINEKVVVSKNEVGKVTKKESEKVVQKESKPKEIKEKVLKENYQEVDKVEKESKKQILVEEPIKQRQSGSAKLAIIIDDVTTKKQVDKIQSIGYPITMAFMPPTNTHKDSAIIAQTVATYMVHLPMEATTRGAEESDTLHIGDTMNVIEKRIKQLKILYPKAIYYNNHTGSRFTADENSMDMLIQVLKNNNIQFVDSRTTPKSVVKQYAIKHGMRYIGRNIFLDNTPTKNAIKAQLKKAVEIDKKNGSAIAIGHPYGATMEALKESKEMLKGIDIVMIDKI